MSDEGSIIRQLIVLAVPTFGQLIAEPIFVLIDTAIVGHLGPSSLAGLSLGSTVILTAVGLCIFLAYATTSQVAKHFGAGKRREGLQAAMDSIWLAFIIGVVLAAALFLLAEPICSALGGSGEGLDQGVAYTRAVVLGAPAMLMVFATNGLFRGLQKMRITLVAAIFGAVTNTILDVVFIFAFGWGVAGSGYATFVAQWAMSLFLLVPALKWIREGEASLRPRLAGVGAAGQDGLPLFLRTLFLRAALVATVMTAATMGTEVLASYQVVNATWNFALNILDATAIAAQTLVGTELGAKRFDRARYITKLSARVGLVLGIIVGALFALAGLIAAPLFSPDVEVQRLASVGMIVVGCGLPLQGWMWALDGILIGAGDYRYLAATVGITAVVYVAVLFGLVLVVFPVVVDPIVRIALLWAAFDLVLMGGRAIGNGLRVRQDAWMLA